VVFFPRILGGIFQGFSQNNPHKDPRGTEMHRKRDNNWPISRIGFGKYLNKYIEDLDGILLRILVMILAKIRAKSKICSEHKIKD
jgi:hypothetical protein